MASAGGFAPLSRKPSTAPHWQDAENSLRTSNFSELLLASSSYSGYNVRSQPYTLSHWNTREGAGTLDINAKLCTEPDSSAQEDDGWYLISKPAEALTRQAILMATPDLDTIYDRGMQTLEAIQAQRLQEFAAKQPVLPFPGNSNTAYQNASHAAPVQQAYMPSAMQQCSNSFGGGDVMANGSSQVRSDFIQRALSQPPDQTHIQRAQLFHQLMTRSSQFHHKFVQAVNQTLPSFSPLKQKMAALAHDSNATDFHDQICQELSMLHQAMHAEQVIHPTPYSICMPCKNYCYLGNSGI